MINYRDSQLESDANDASEYLDNGKPADDADDVEEHLACLEVARELAVFEIPVSSSTKLQIVQICEDRSNSEPNSALE